MFVDNPYYHVLYYEYKIVGNTESREVTGQGTMLGIRREWLRSQRGIPYEVYHLSEFAQKEIIRKLLQE